MALSRFVLTNQVTLPAGVPVASEPSGPPVTTGPSTTGVAPTALTTITSQALAAGTYLLSWTGQLGGTAAGGDANNFGLYGGATGVTQLVVGVNAAVISTPFPQASVVYVVPVGGGTVAVKNIGAGTAAATYTATLTVQPLASAPPDSFGTVSWAGPGAPPAWAEGFPVLLLKGQTIYADSTAGSTGPQLLYQAIGAANLRAYVVGQDDVGHASLSN
jgi:hypothetical protein